MTRNQIQGLALKKYNVVFSFLFVVTMCNMKYICIYFRYIFGVHIIWK